MINLLARFIAKTTGLERNLLPIVHPYRQRGFYAKSSIPLTTIVILILLAACNRAPLPSAPPPSNRQPPAPTAVVLTPTATNAPSPTAEPAPKLIAPQTRKIETSAKAWSCPSTGWHRLEQRRQYSAITAYKDLLLLNAAGLSVIKQVTLQRMNLCWISPRTATAWQLRFTSRPSTSPISSLVRSRRQYRRGCKSWLPPFRPMAASWWPPLQKNGRR